MSTMLFHSVKFAPFLLREIQSAKEKCEVLDKNLMM